jgi:multiple sugar transport system permease protein
MNPNVALGRPAAPTTGRAAARGPGRHERRTGLLLALPALAAYAALILVPFSRSLWLALCRFTLDNDAPIFTGLENFRRLFADPAIPTVWLNTAVFVIGTTGATFVLALAWAVMMNQPFRGRGLVRTVSLLPWVLPSTVTAFLFAWIFNGQYGVLNALLLTAHIIDEPITWLADKHGAMLAICMAKAWLSVPLYMAFLLAGLQSVSGDQVDAARVDGCRNWGVMRHVVLPHLAPTIVVVLILGAMSNLQAFDVIYAMTQGGPVKGTTTLSVQVYQRAFEDWDLGAAAAVGVLWFATIAVPASYYLRLLLRRGK